MWYASNWVRKPSVLSVQCRHVEPNHVTHLYLWVLTLDCEDCYLKSLSFSHGHPEVCPIHSVPLLRFLIWIQVSSLCWRCIFNVSGKEDLLLLKPHLSYFFVADMGHCSGTT